VEIDGDNDCEIEGDKLGEILVDSDGLNDDDRLGEMLVEGLTDGDIL